LYAEGEGEGEIYGLKGKEECGHTRGGGIRFTHLSKGGGGRNPSSPPRVSRKEKEFLPLLGEGEEGSKKYLTSLN